MLFLGMDLTEEDKRIISEINNTEHPLPPEMLPELIAAGLRRDPEKTAVIAGGREYRACEVESDLQDMTAFLMQEGLRPGETVALMFRKGYQQISAALGTTYAGCAYSPIEYGLPLLRVKESLQSGKAKLLITDEENRARLKESGLFDFMEIYTWEEARIKNHQIAGPRIPSGSDNFAVIFTSGSTGKPKGVQVTFDNIRNCFAHTAWFYSVGPENRSISVTNFCHDMSIYELYGTISNGGSVVMPDADRETDPAHWAELMIRYEVNTWDSVPTLANLLTLALEQEDLKIPSMKMMILGGEFVPIQVVKDLQHYLPNVQIYTIGGPTEKTIWNINHKVEPKDLTGKVIPYGRPIWNTEYYILDENLKLLPPGQIGVIYNTGMSVTKGYTDYDLTQERYIRHPLLNVRMYNTGDLGSYNKDGYIEIHGRADNQVKIQGKRIELGEIENVLGQSDMVSQTAVTALKEQIYAFCTLKEEYVTDKLEDNWSQVFDETYSGQREDAAGEKEDFSSWFSSYTHKPIPLEEMRSWRDLTLKRIDAVKGKRIFEIGCGTGLLLHRLAPECESFVGIDISQVAVDNLKKELEADGITNTEVYCKGAGDLAEFADRKFDTIIINSVIHFFRDDAYLLDVIRQCGKMLDEGGCLFIGDVRNYDLLELFHASVIFAGAPEDADLESLRQRIRERLEREKELTVSPAFFKAACRILPEYSSVRIQCKESEYDNELTRFRYDVTLQRAVTDEAGDTVFFDGAKTKIEDSELEQALTAGKNVRVTNIPHGYLLDSIRRFCDVEHRNFAFSDQELQNAHIPHHYHALAERCGYQCCVETDASGRMDIRIGREICADLQDAETNPDKLSDCVNEPSQELTTMDFVQELRAFAGEYLPGYMIPDRISILQELPTLQNGKIDRKALKAMAEEEREARKDQQEAEDALQDVDAAKEPTEFVRKFYRGMFHEDVDPDAPFLTIGGHSLLAMQLLSAVKKNLGVTIRLSEFMQDSTMNHVIQMVTEAQDTADAAETSGPETEPVYQEDVEHRFEPFPLNAMQQSYYFGRSSNVLGGVPTSMYLEFCMESLDIERLEEAVNQLAARHEMLRCIIDEDAKQRILQDPERVHITVEDYGPLDEEKQTQTRQEIYDEIYDMIDLNHFPAFICRAVRFGTEQTYLYLVFDSTFIDGASVSILIHDLGELYAGKTLEPLKASFKDYCRFLDGSHQSREYQESMSYWCQRKDSLPGAPALPVLSENGDGEHAGTIRRAGLVDAETWQNIKVIAKEQSLSLFVVQVTMFSMVLARWSGDPHFTLNVPIFNRMDVKEDIAKTVGEFGSLIFLEVDLDPDAGFLENCRKIQKQFEQDMDHRRANGVEVMKELRKKGREMNLPVVFTSLTTPSGDDGLYSQFMELKRWRSQSSQVWLDSIVFDKDGGLELAWDCYDGIFDPVMLEDMFAAYVDGFAQIPDMDRFLGKTVNGCLQGRNYNRILEINETEYTYEDEPKLLHAGFLKTLQSTPQAVACVTENRTLTYEELYRCAADVAQQLKAQGMGRGDYVAVQMKRGWKQVAAALGVLFAGAAYVPVSDSWPMERVDRILEAAKIRAVVSDGVTKTPAEIVRIDVEESSCERPCPGFSVELNLDPKDVAYVIYTSGSTGLPKGVVIQHEAAVNTLLAVNRMHQVGAGDRAIMLSELYFDLSVYDIFGMFYAGGAVYVPSDEEKQDVTCWNRILTERDITLWNTVPAFMQMLMEINEGGDICSDTLRIVMMSGDWIPLNLPDRIKMLLPKAKVMSLGGATEASIWSNYYWVDDVKPEWKSIPYGYPMDNQKMLVLDGNLDICPEHVEGDIYIGGIGLAKEYLNEPELTEQKFIFCEKLGCRLYFTGDRGRYYSGGSIEFLGRSDTQVKINGFRVELGEIKGCALKDGRIDAAIANYDRKQNLLSFYYKTNAPVSEEELQELFKNNLPEYMIPAVMRQIQEVPVNANGKVDKKQLPVLERADAGTSSEILTDTQRGLQAIYQDILGVTEIGLDDNFFRIGGDSIRAIMLLHSIARAFPAKVQLTDIFAHPTIREMAEHLEKNGGGQAVFAHEEITDAMELSAAQKGIWFQAKSAEASADGAYGFVLVGSYETETAGFDWEAYQQAICMTAEDNVDLRTEIYEKDFVPYVRYRDDFTCPMKQLDPRETVEATTRMLQEEALDAVDSINRYPLFAFRSADTADGRTVIALAVHHVIADAASIDLMLEEIEKKYQKLKQGETPKPDKPEYNYHDFAAWQKKELAEGGFDEDFQYWKESLQGLELMSFSEGITVQEGGSAQALRRDVEISEETMKKLEALCTENNISLYNGFSAIMAMMMKYYFASDRIVMGMAYGAREHHQFERVLGSFATGSITVTPVGAQDDFCSIARNAAAAAEDAMKHSSLPFHLLVEKNGLDLEYAQAPYHVLIDCLETAGSGRKSDFTPFVYSQQRIPAELVLTIEPARGDHPVGMLYRTNRFVEEQIDEYCRTLEEILEVVAEHDRISMEELEQMLDGKEQEE